MFPEIFQQRLKDLEDNIRKELELLKDYEDGLRYKSSSNLKQKYRQDIEERKYYIVQYQREYRELKQNLDSSSSLTTPEVASQFQQIDEKLNILIINQGAIAEDLEKTRQDLLNRYDYSEQIMVGAIAGQLDRFQLALTQKLLYAMEANLVSEQQMQQMLTVLEKRISYLPPSQAEKVAKVIKDPEIDSAHKLKVSLPIVPLLVEYEGTIELESGLNLKTVWEQLIAKLRKQPKQIGKPIGNYTKLRELLEAGKWREADLETTKIILKITKREKQGWLKTQDIKKFPLLDLQTINNLWVKFSKGHFGFSVQRDIWLCLNGQPGKFDSNIFPKFGTRVGWNVDEEWLKYERLNFSLDAPEGHLPSLQLKGVENEPDWLGLWKDTFKGFLSRVETYLSK